MDGVGEFINITWYICSGNAHEAILLEKIQNDQDIQAKKTPQCIHHCQAIVFVGAVNVLFIVLHAFLAGTQVSSVMQKYASYDCTPEEIWCRQANELRLEISESAKDAAS
jgi:hypothetical protein